MTGSRKRPRAIFAVLAIGVSSYSLLQSLTVPTLPTMERELQTDQAAAAWVLTAFLLYGFGAGVSEAGHMMLPAAVGIFVCGLLAARLAAWLGVRRVLIMGSFIVAGALCIAAFAHDDKWQLYLAGCLIGLGVGLTFACLANAVVAAVPARQTGAATGMNANIRTVGGAVGAAIMTTLVTADTQATGYPAEGGYTAGFGFLAAVALMAALAGLLVPRLSLEDAS